jgi:hypothetical protein
MSSVKQKQYYSYNVTHIVHVKNFNKNVIFQTVSFTSEYQM